MRSFFANRSLSRGDLSLFLTNGAGLSQDGYDVRWTVYRGDGLAASGLSVPATKVSTGEYFAPWGCAKSGGCYLIRWEYGEAPGLPRRTWDQEFFVLEGSGGCCSSYTAPRDAGPSINCGAFYSGQPLGPGDLCLHVLDDDGLPSQAFLVLWTILDACGCPVTQRAQALPGPTLGDYCASWTPSCAGNFTVRWEWMLYDDSPMESTCDSFSVVNPPALFSRCGEPMSKYCPPPAVPNVIVVKDCGGGTVVVPRTVVLANQTLPLGGAYTDQAAFSFPPEIRHITFYIKYAHGAQGGFPVLRLMWGNGFEEIASTVIDATFSSSDGYSSSQDMRISDLRGPTPSGPAPEQFMLETSVPGGTTTVRLLIAEGGQIGIPGTAEITLTGSSG